MFFALAAMLLFLNMDSSPVDGMSMNMMSPRLQMAHGVLLQNVSCPSGLVLIKKLSANSVACVKPQIAQKLVERGWGTMNLSSIQTKTSYSLAFFLKTSGSHYNDNLQVFKNNLKSGDYLLIRGEPSSPMVLIQKVQLARSMFNSGVNVDSVLFYYKIDDLIKEVPNLPKGIDFIIYDYEKGANYSPEFTTDEATSIGFFDNAKDAVAQYNKNTGSNAKFMVTPPYGELRSADWDWGLAAKHMDAMDLQVQAFLKDLVTVKGYVSSAVNQITQGSPNTLTFIQLSIVHKRGTLDENVAALNALKNPRINAFLIWYQANQTEDLNQLFNLLSR